MWVLRNGHYLLLNQEFGLNYLIRNIKLTFHSVLKLYSEINLSTINKRMKTD